MRVYFYPHPYLRDRQLDTIRRWPAAEAVNPELAERAGAQVSAKAATGSRMGRSWKQRLPLINVKRRPTQAPADAAVYVWGGIIATGPFILDLDNPWALVGYNVPAMTLWRPVLAAVLASKRCLAIRCMSDACRQGVARLFGRRAAAKAVVAYPRLAAQVGGVEAVAADGPRFVMVGTQFAIKGGIALLRAWPRVRAALPGARLDVVTHLPAAYADLARQPGLEVHEARFSRDQIWQRFLRPADVLVHPTYVESFGMVALEALAHGLALVSTDVYALPELVTPANGRLVAAPLSVWDGVMPSPHYRAWEEMPAKAEALDSAEFETRLAEAMIEVAADPARLLASRRASLELFRSRFAGAAP